MNNTLLTQEVPLSFGDKRLDKRYQKIIETVVKQPSLSIPAAFKNFYQTKAVYRFVRNSKVNSKKLLEHQHEETLQHIEALEEEKDILTVQDTTTLNYSTHESKEELGRIYSYVERGLLVHPTVAFTPTGINLGLLHAKMWTRNVGSTSKNKKELQKRPIQTKESYRWLESLQTSEKVAQKFPNKNIFNISDREGDIYQLFLKSAKNEIQNLYFIVRSTKNRITNTPERKLKETLQKAPVMGRLAFQYKKANSSRLVKQVIRVEKIELSNPPNSPTQDPITVYALLAQEEHPPQGQKPIEWLILTDCPIETPEDAKKILTYYTKRWEIEIFFKVLKSGCKVEGLRFAKRKRLETTLVLYMIISCKIMFLLKLGREYADISCEAIFSRLEWQVVYMAAHNKKPPKEVPKLGEIIICIATLGGYLNRKTDPPPGPKAMWIGVQQMHTLIWGFELRGKFST
jgi:hypothetical protein